MSPLALALLVGSPVHAAPLDRELAQATRDGRLPQAWATRSADGRWMVEITPAGGWSSAELSVAGVETIDLGPAPGGRPLRVEGEGAAADTLHLTLQAALPDGAGVTWRFAIEPESVPVAGPRTGPRADRPRGLLWRLGWGRP